MDYNSEYSAAGAGIGVFGVIMYLALIVLVVAGYGKSLKKQENQAGQQLFLFTI